MWPKYERSDILHYIRSRFGDGLPSGLYRSASEIKRDMDIIEEKIKETESKLTVRNILSTLWESSDNGEKIADEDTIAILDSIVADAERSLFHMERLRDGLNYLEEELSELRWLLKNDA
jgi:hypothetical protein